MSNFKNTAYYQCQDLTCQENVSFNEDDLRNHRGEPLCQYCADEPEYINEMGEDGIERWSDLPTWKSPETIEIERAFLILSRPMPPPLRSWKTRIKIMGKRSDYTKRKADYYRTWDFKAVAPLLPFLQPGTTFIEPFAGDGVLVDHLESQLNAALADCMSANQRATKLETQMKELNARILNWENILEGKKEPMAGNTERIWSHG